MPTTLPPEAGATLTRLARSAIASRFHEAPGPPRADWLEAEGAAFVTLTIGGALRGCIGSLEAYRPLGDDVADNARAAAFRDPRFPALSEPELERCAVEVSVLDAPEPMGFESEADALAQLRPGVDGVILADGRRRATFLPQVWESLPGPAEFMGQLKRKAGLRADHWGPGVRLWRYGVTAFEEP
ncbi:MAG: AmmeMemoRadiSam system protein A [Propionibacteriaceae bacterium]|jgi:AmmeMemoRadiSam system protein A|nr:AmmeMemoRadiSam system protein A [Propionibacteriaceae bacterium]